MEQVYFDNGNFYTLVDGKLVPINFRGFVGGGTKRVTNNIISEQWINAGQFTFQNFKDGTLTPDVYGSYLPIGNVTANEFVSDLIITQNVAFAPFNAAWQVSLGNGAFTNPLNPMTYVANSMNVNSNTLNGRTARLDANVSQRYPLASQPITILLYDIDKVREISELTVGSINVWYKKELLS